MMARVHWLADTGWRLGQAAAAGAFSLASLVAGIAWIAGGPALGAAAGAGAAAALLFFALGHSVQILVARRHEGLILAASLMSYTVQVALVTVLIWGLAERGFNRPGLFAGLVAAVAGWLTGLIWAFRQARIPVFDPPTDEADGQTMTSADSPGRLPADERSEGQ
jgi:hypothetical protein